MRGEADRTGPSPLPALDLRTPHDGYRICFSGFWWPIVARSLFASFAPVARWASDRSRCIAKPMLTPRTLPWRTKRTVSVRPRRRQLPEDRTDHRGRRGGQRRGDPSRLRVSCGECAFQRGLSQRHYRVHRPQPRGDGKLGDKNTAREMAIARPKSMSFPAATA